MVLLGETGSYYRKNFIDFAPIRRISAHTTKDADGNYVINNTQEKLKNAFFMNASIGTLYPLQEVERSLSINFMVNNVS
jgi:hypothetical protein